MLTLTSPAPVSGHPIRKDAGGGVGRWRGTRGEGSEQANHLCLGGVGAMRHDGRAVAVADNKSLDGAFGARNVRSPAARFLGNRVAFQRSEFVAEAIKHMED